MLCFIGSRLTEDVDRRLEKRYLLWETSEWCIVMIGVLTKMCVIQYDDPPPNWVGDDPQVEIVRTVCMLRRQTWVARYTDNLVFVTEHQPVSSAIQNRPSYWSLSVYSGTLAHHHDKHRTIAEQVAEYMQLTR